MKVIFFKVDEVLNFPESDAFAPSGVKGVAEARVKELKNLVQESGARLVLFGSWKPQWNFDDTKCTPDGVYLNKKLNRRGLHILDKTRDLPENADISDWLDRHPNVTDFCVLKNMQNIKWEQR